MNTYGEIGDLELCALEGDLQGMMKAFENGDSSWDHACSMAAESGHLECLKYAHENGAAWNVSTTTLAAQKGHLECLKYAHENGCPWDNACCMYAAYRENIDCLKYAHENGCPWDEHNMCAFAAFGGNLQCLKYARENGCSWDERTCFSATGEKSFECLKYLHENGCPWDGETINSAIVRQSLKSVQYAHENGCPWTDDSCWHVVYRGNHTLIKYAYDNGCPWLLETVIKAIQETDNIVLLKETLNSMTYEQISNILVIEYDTHTYSYITWYINTMNALEKGNLEEIDENDERILETLRMQELIKKIKARNIILRAMERAYLDPQYSWCIRRLKRSYEEMMSGNYVRGTFVAAS